MYDRQPLDAVKAALKRAYGPPDAPAAVAGPGKLPDALQRALDRLATMDKED